MPILERNHQPLSTSPPKTTRHEIKVLFNQDRPALRCGLVCLCNLGWPNGQWISEANPCTGVLQRLRLVFQEMVGRRWFCARVTFKDNPGRWNKMRQTIPHDFTQHHGMLPNHHRWFVVGNRVTCYHVQTRNLHAFPSRSSFPSHLSSQTL